MTEAVAPATIKLSTSERIRKMRLPILILHIMGGMVGLLSGAAAISFRKGSSAHRMAGNVFVVSMLMMGACGSFLALLKHQMNNVFGGLLIVYLITTAWLTGRRRDGATGVFDWIALLTALSIGASLLTLALRVVAGQSEPQAGVPVGMYFFMGAVPLLAAAGDLRMLAGDGISDLQRLRRHLWRMCFGLFIASGSFFLGQPQVFPNWLRKTNVLFVPAILPLLLMVFWLFRVRFRHTYNTQPISTTNPAY
jgi:Predicted membrane protein (DUF2306)